MSWRIYATNYTNICPMKKRVYNFESEVWLWPSEISAWHMVSVPREMSAKILASYAGLTRGFGSLRVEAQIGKTKWNTSIFPERKTAEFVLPLKAQVRRKEGIFVKDHIKVCITISV